MIKNECASVLVREVFLLRAKKHLPGGRRQQRPDIR
ncbi:hypothetical protein Tph_c22220 [Thermacetogenium phaeum DSM 12270]|jgi:hypothetical protein|uniref:Uncharacterized protein n=1 Tax=Thermacetogenium phaeum (strain ATCC BAA-254 / DSM 26808 / PB) TaxID=1089553 RepID=K4LK20_THEPS|nr:hypothetical protein Tph_c22220 [Thermacetogenium phaeum DSM 12270]